MAGVLWFLLAAWKTDSASRKVRTEKMWRDQRDLRLLGKFNLETKTAQCGAANEREGGNDRNDDVSTLVLRRKKLFEKRSDVCPERVFDSGGTCRRANVRKRSMAENTGKGRQNLRKKASLRRNMREEDELHDAVKIAGDQRVKKVTKKGRMISFVREALGSWRQKRRSRSRTNR